MKNRSISTKTILDPYGLVRVSGEVSRNPFYAHEERQFEPAFEVSDLHVFAEDGECLHGKRATEIGRFLYCGLDDIEVEKCHEVLIEKFLEDEGFESDRLIDEAIESGRQYKHLAYA